MAMAVIVVLTRGIVDIVATKCKEGCKQGDALRYSSTVDASHRQVRFCAS